MLRLASSTSKASSKLTHWAISRKSSRLHLTLPWDLHCVKADYQVISEHATLTLWQLLPSGQSALVSQWARLHRDWQALADMSQSLRLQSQDTGKSTEH
jgi:hypothetical protein